MLRERNIEDQVYKSLDKENLNKIINFLVSNGCDYLDELLDNYLDLFTIDFDEFKNKFNKLNNKYNYNLINEISNDMSILDEFYKND